MSHDDRRPRVGISSCLLGAEVRYDGGHKRDAYLLASIGTLVEWVPVCPEVEAGMGAPREPIHLVASEHGVPAGGARVRLMGVHSGTDWTHTMTTFAEARVRELAGQRLDGYVCKSDSPSCGLEVHVQGGDAPRGGRGLFAEALAMVFPELPVEEDSRLSDRAARERFLERVFAHQRQRGRRQA